MSVTIRVDFDVYDRLKDQAEPFVDTPNSVLRRILGLDPASVEDLGTTIDVGARPVSTRSVKHSSTPSATARRPRRADGKRARAPAGSLFPEEGYELPLLAVLLEKGGSAPSREVVAGVGEKVRGELTDVDNELISSGGVRWQNRVQFVRLRLVERGLMAKDSPRGVWQITDAGRAYASQNTSGVA